MTGRRTQEQRRASSRERLITAAIHLLAERGYARTSLVEIGRAAGLSRGLVSHHFGSKEACMRAVIEQIREDVSHGAGAGDVDALIDFYFAGVRGGDPRARAMYVVLVEALTSTPGLRPAVAETNAISRALIVAMLPSADADADLEPVAVLVEALLRGVALQWLADPEHVDLDAAAVTAKAMIRSAAGARPARP